MSFITQFNLMFVKYSSSRNRAIGKRTARPHDGTGLSDVGKGSTFIVTLTLIGLKVNQ